MAYKKRTTPDGKPLWKRTWVAEWVADTGHLSAFEFGCLERLNLNYWRSGPPRDEDETLARICGCTIADWKKARYAIEPFFEVGYGQWTCQRLDDDLAEAYSLISANKRRTKGATDAAAAKRKALRDGQRDDERHDLRYESADPEEFDKKTTAQFLGNERSNAGFKAISSVTDDVTDSVTDSVAINKLEVHRTPAPAKAANGFSSSENGALTQAVLAAEAAFGEVRHA